MAKKKKLNVRNVVKRNITKDYKGYKKGQTIECHKSVAEVLDKAKVTGKKVDPDSDESDEVDELLKDK